MGIVGKVQMSNNFLSMKTLGKDKNKSHAGRQSQFSTGLNVPMGARGSGTSSNSGSSKSFITRKSVLGLSNQQMTMVHKLSGAGISEEINAEDMEQSNSDSAEGEDLIGEAHDDLEQLARDLKDSDDSNSN